MNSDKGDTINGIDYRTREYARELYMKEISGTSLSPRKKSERFADMPVDYEEFIKRIEEYSRGRV